MEEFRKIEVDSTEFRFEKIKTFEIISVLGFDPKQFSAICRVLFKDPSTKVEDVFYGNRSKIVVLEEEKEGSYVFFVKEKTQGHDQKFIRTGVYLAGPCEIRDGRIKIGILGETRQLKACVSLIDKLGVNYKVVSLTDAKFSPRSPMGFLTDKQRTVLVSAFEQGYYDMPRKISSQQLAKKLSLRGSTVIEHRRKAERRLLAAVLSEL